MQHSLRTYGKRNTENVKLKYILEARTFGRIRKEVPKTCLFHVCMSVRPHETIRQPLHGFSRNLTLGSFIKICPHIPMQFKTGQRWTFYMHFCTDLKQLTNYFRSEKWFDQKLQRKIKSIFIVSLEFSRILMTKGENVPQLLRYGHIS
jgi:hypothetical protein